MQLINEYLKNRVRHHANLYHKKIQEDFNMTIFDDVIFDILFFIIQSKLSQGHTVFVLSENWQKEITDELLSDIYNELGFIFDVQDMFNKIDEHINNPSGLKIIIDDILYDLKTKHQTHQISANIKLQRNHVENEQFIHGVCQKVLWVLRFYYYSTHKMDGTLSSLVDKLKNHCFFGENRTDRPIVWLYHQHELYLWLNRIYHAERKLLRHLNALHQADIDKITPTELNLHLNHEQKQAVWSIFNHSVSIITGGPGTGKTFTIAQAVSALYQEGQGIGLALVAPTGKAAQRMKESLMGALSGDIELAEPMTIHRLLGIGKSGLPRYTADNPLPFDLVIVDEASMIGVELASQLLAGIKLGARLVLLGDTHQLFAVEAGSVLSDLCHLPMMADGHVTLKESRRFGEHSGVGNLARLVNDDRPSVTDVLRVIDRYDELSFYDIKKLGRQDISHLYASITLPYECDGGYFELTKHLRYRFYQASDDQKHNYIKQLHDELGKYRILCASHLSECGDIAINQHIKEKHLAHLNVAPNIAFYVEWYHGRVVMVLKNRYDLGLFNGDIGICVQTGRRANDLTVFFYGDTIKSFPTNLLSGDVVSTAYAMTIHKSQGSEFDTVAVVCHDVNGRLLSKELLYTAITRAKTNVQLYSTPTAIDQAISQPTIRHTGLGVHEVGQGDGLNVKGRSV